MINRYRSFLSEFHPVVHMLLFGTVGIVLARSMSIPFLAIFLSSRHHLNPATIGLILGAGSIAGTFGGLIGGTLSDYIGRKKVLVGTLYLTALVFVGFELTSSTSVFFLLNIILGLGSSFYDPVSKAMLGDLVPQEKRMRIFSLRYVAINIGFAVGPLLGSFLGLVQNNLSFIITASVYVLYGIVLMMFLQKVQLQNDNEDNSSEKVGFRQSLGVIRRDMALLFLTIGGVLTMTVHGEMSVMLSQYLTIKFTDGVQLFSVMMSVNAITVVAFQYVITKMSEKWKPLKSIAIGSLLLGLGEVGFAVANGWVTMIIAMLVFTLAEIFIIPAEYLALDRITPDGMRGMYYGAQTFSNLGNFIGPWFGGILLASYGGPVMFITMGVIAVLAIYFFWRAQKISERKSAAVTDSITC